MPFESDAMLQFYHYTFQTFHIALILFNVLGWIPRPTARLNLITLVATGLSWTVLGAFYGLGYCPLTDWHYGVLERLGRYNLPVSYIAFLIEEIWSIRIATATADWITGTTYALALLASVLRNIKIRQTLP
ncbi:DUF2784 family protein [Leptonema illini]|nr:DUF2784 family protein [Leptonema illini]